MHGARIFVPRDKSRNLGGQKVQPLSSYTQTQFSQPYASISGTLQVCLRQDTFQGVMAGAWLAGRGRGREVGLSSPGM